MPTSPTRPGEVGRDSRQFSSASRSFVGAARRQESFRFQRAVTRTGVPSTPVFTKLPTCL